MFDTITLRLHGVQKYAMLKQILFDPVSGQRKFMTIDKAHAMVKEIDRDEVRTFIHYLDKDKVFEFHYARKIVLPSSNYEFNYFCNMRRGSGGYGWNDIGYFEFEFSIPKFLHGTNVYQAIYHKMDIPGSPGVGTLNRFKWYKDEKDILSLPGNADWAHDYLIQFIKQRFFKYLFPFIEIDMMDVQIARLDVCFNQVFRTKIDALNYLSYQRDLRKKYSRENSDYVRDWSTAITYVGSLYSFKIYHKGTEFAKKGDRKELLRINRERGFEMYDISQLQDLADRTLRYEVTAHSKYLSYLHNQYIFRRKDVKHLLHMQCYNRIRGDLNKAAGSYRLMSREDKIFYKSFSKIISKRYEFRVKVDEFREKYHSDSRFVNDYIEAPFLKKLTGLLIAKLYEHFQQFKVHDRIDKGDLLKSIEKYNERVKQMVKTDSRIRRPYTQMEIIEKKFPLNYRPTPQEEYFAKLEALEKNAELKKIKREHTIQKSLIQSFLMHYESFGSFEELRRSGIYSRMTLHNILKKLKKFGFNPNSRVEVKRMHVCDDFRDYHDYLLYHPNLRVDF